MIKLMLVIACAVMFYSCDPDHQAQAKEAAAMFPKGKVYMDPGEESLYKVVIDSTGNLFLLEFDSGDDLVETYLLRQFEDTSDIKIYTQ